MKHDEHGNLTELAITPTGDYSEYYECIFNIKNADDPHYVEFVINEDGHTNNPILDGFIKWDGCMELHGGHHTCSLKQIQALNKFVVEIYQKAYELMKNRAEKSAFFEPIYNDLPF